jgi:hypothetical protein
LCGGGVSFTFILWMLVVLAGMIQSFQMVGGIFNYDQ